jgi:2-hydroxy-3-keto-5-methylthiopentenyl-1-phosphate phosphatase
MIVQRNIVFLVRPLSSEKSSEIVVFAHRPDATRYCERRTPAKKEWKDYYDIVHKTVRIR